MKAKRFLALFLCLCLVTTFLPMTALADGEAEITNVVTFQVRTANEASGTVSYRFGSEGEFVAVTPDSNGAASVNVPDGATNITVKAEPADGYTVNQNQSGIWVDGSNVITDVEKTTFFSDLLGNGYTYTLPSSEPQFQIEFDNNDGTGGNGSENGNQQQSDNIEVQFDTESIADNVASFTVNETSVTVTVNNANISNGKVSVPRNNLGSVTFTLGNTYDSETMQVIVRGADNYSSVLEVSNITVSLDGLNIPDGGLHFSVEAIGGGENPDPGGEDPGHPQSGTEISFGPEQGVTLAVNGGIITFTDSESVSIGTVQVYMGNSIDAYTEYLSTELPEARLAIPEGTTTVKIVLEPEGDLEAQLVYGGDIRDAGAISGPDFDDDTSTYTYTITVENIPENDSGSKFVGITVEFGTNLGGGEDFTAVIWNGDQVEQQSANGTISVASIEIGTTTYTYNSTTGKFDDDNGELLEWYHDNSGESGVRIKDTAFGESQNVEVYINFVFKPDYGYQVTGVGTNENPTSLMQGVSAAEAVSTYKFPVFCNNNPHFTVVFSPSEDVTDVSGAQNVSAATIADGQNATDSGNLKLTVADLSGDELNDAQNAFANQMQATDDTDNIMYLDVDLFQVVSKGTAGSNWETQLTDLEGEISVTLNVGAQAGVAYYVIRQHTAQDGAVTYTREQAINNGDGTITFTTNQFSTYALFTGIGYTITLNANGGTVNGDNTAILVTDSGNKLASLPTPTRSGSYAFSGWYTSANGGTQVTTATEFTSNQTIYAHWTYTGSSGGGGYIPSTPATENVTVPISGDESSINVGASVSGDKATIDEVDLSHLDTVIGEDVQTGTVTIDFSNLDSSKPITTVVIPSDVVKQIAEAVNDPANDAESLEVVLSDGTSIEFDAAALSEKAAQADGLDITIAIEHYDDAELTDAQKNAVGSRPAFDINVTSGGKHISDMGGKITVHAPYELKAGEKARGIVVWYVDDAGNRERCETSYDPVRQRVNWKTDHLSLYMIDYDEALANKPFTDVSEDAYYFDAVLWAVDKGITNGTGATTFSPDASCTRAQMATFLWRAAGSPDPVGSTNPFNDVLSDAYYAKAVQWAVEQGITVGTSATTFSPDADCTRAQMATFLWRNAGSPAPTGSTNPFTDVPADIYYTEAVQWAYEHKITGGTSATTFSPDANCTRAQMVTFLYRFFVKKNQDSTL